MAQNYKIGTYILNTWTQAIPYVNDERAGSHFVGQATQIDVDGGGHSNMVWVLIHHSFSTFKLVFHTVNIGGAGFFFVFVFILSNTVSY